MASEKGILAAFILNRDAYDLLQPVIKEDDFSIQAQIIYKYINDFYNKDSDAIKIDKDILLSKIARKHQKHTDMFATILEDIEDYSVPNVVEEFIALKKHTCSQELSTLLLGEEEEEIKLKIQEYQELTDVSFLNQEDDSVIYKPDLVTMFEETQETDTIPVIPGALNTILKGKLRRGHHIIVFAVVEVGKTLFTLNLTVGFCTRGYKVLYLCNEEPIDDILDRFLSRFTMIDIDDIRKNPEETHTKAYANGFNNLILIKSHAGSCGEIERLVREHKPDVLVVDQIKNLEIPGTNGDEMSTVIKASRFMRKIGKQYNLVPISVTQAGDSAYNKTILQLRDIYSSKTSVAGDADLMIGIGMNEDMARQNRRLINLPKNKISGKHEYFAVEFDTRHNRVISL